MAQSLKELLSFTETVGYSSLPVENQNKIQAKILRLQYEECKIQREVEEKKAKELRQKAEDDAFAVLRTKSIQEISSVMNGFIPIYSFRNPVPFTVDFLRGNNGTVTFNCESEPFFSLKDLLNLSERLDTLTIGFSQDKTRTKYDDRDYDDNWTFTVRFPWNK